jgi:hypothetical protein
MVQPFDSGVALVALDTVFALIPAILNNIEFNFIYPMPLTRVSQSSGKYLNTSGGLLKSLV